MLPAPYATPAAVLLAAGGLLTCFAGYRLFRLVLGINGFILGVIVALSLTWASGVWTLVMAAVVGGVVGALLMMFGVGLIGAGLAAIVINLVWRVLALGDPPTVILVIVCVIGALAAMWVERWVVVIGTSIIGAGTLLVGVSALMGNPKSLEAASAGDVWVIYPFSGGWMHTLLWFAIAIAGAVVQWLTSKKSAKAKSNKRKPGLPK